MNTTFAAVGVSAAKLRVPNRCLIYRLMLCRPIIALLTMLLAGCPRADQKPSEKASPSKADRTEAELGESTSDSAKNRSIVEDATQIAQLEALGVLLIRNDEGLVIQAALTTDRPLGDELSNLAGIPHVQQLTLSGPTITDQVIAPIAKLPKLKRLDLTDAAIGDGAMEIASQIKTLEVLFARRTGISDEGMAPLSNLPKLRALDIRNSNIGDPGLAYIAKMNGLVDLQLERTKITDAGVARLVKLPLKSINVNTTAVTNAALATFGKMPSLESIQMDSTRITDDAVGALASLPKLKRLRIRFCDITGVGFAEIAKCKSLERLELRDTSLDDAGVVQLASLPKLQYLDVSECVLPTSKGLQPIGTISSLTYLNLWGTKTNDETVAAFTGLTKLKELNLQGTAVTDQSAESLAKLTSLERIDISGTSMGDAAARTIVELPNLRSIVVSNSGVSFELIDEWFANRSELEIVE